jgi:hypothetical protein|eukprot:COSAG03_NODE_318_length_9038_cov_19.855017_6_plen_63_part_00
MGDVEAQVDPQGQERSTRFDPGADDVGPPLKKSLPLASHRATPLTSRRQEVSLRLPVIVSFV